MTRTKVLSHLRAASGPTTVAELSRALGLPPNTVRFHLRRLTETGQVVQQTATDHRPGRPALLYSATRQMDPAGPTQYPLLAQVLLSSLAPGRQGRSRLVSAGRDAGHRIAAARGEARGAATERLVALLEDLGFAPEPPAGSEIRLRHCPFLDLAAADRTVCAAHLGLMQGVLDEFDADTTVERLDPFVEPDLCVAHLSPRREPAYG